MKRMTTLLSVLVLASVAGAETYPFAGEVTGDKVNVRCGPGLTSYICTQLSKGSRVQVLGKQGEEFLQIEAIPFAFKTKTGCLSVVSSKFIRREAGVAANRPGWGFVTEDNVLVRAGGDKRLKGFYSPQGTLKKDEKIYIIGRMTDETGSEMYLIQSPKCAKYYIAAEYVTKAAPEEPKPIEPVIPVVTTDPVTEPATPVVTGGDAPKPEPSAADVLAGKTPAAGGSIQDEKTILASLKALQASYNAEMAKPVATQNIKDILADAERLNVSGSSEFRPYYDYMLAQMRQTLESRKGTNKFDRIFADAMNTPAGKTPTMASTKPDYDLEGVLYRSQLYTTATDIRYVVRDPKTRRILGYVEAGQASVSLDEYCGKTVLVGGKQTFIANQALSVTQADRIVQVAGDTAVASAKPTVDPTLDPNGTPLVTILPKPMDPVAPIPSVVTPIEPMDPVQPNPGAGADSEMMEFLRLQAEERARAAAELAAGKQPTDPADPIAVVPVPVEPVPIEPIAITPVEPADPPTAIVIRDVPKNPGTLPNSKDLDIERQRLLDALTGKTTPKPVDPIAITPVAPVDPAAALAAEQKRAAVAAAELAAEQRRSAELAAEQRRSAELAAEQRRIAAAAELAAEQREIAAEQHRIAAAAKLAAERERLAAIERERLAAEERKRLAALAVKPVDPVVPQPIDPVAVKPVDPVAIKPIDPVAIKPIDPIAVKPVAPVEPKPIDPMDPIEPKPIDPIAVAPVEPKPIDPMDPIEPKPIEPRTAIADGNAIEATVVQTEFEIEWD